MIRLFRSLWRQRLLAAAEDRAASRWRKFRMGMRWDCYVSPKARVFYPESIELAPGVHISEGAMLNYRSGRGAHAVNLSIGAGTKIMPGAKLVPQQGTIRIGRDCSVQYGCLLYGVGGLEIGDDTRIAAHTVISPMNHVYADPKVPIRKQGETALGVRIGRDVWVGNSVQIVDGVNIGDGAVIGAGSVVTRDISPYCVAVGVPARVIKRRGSKEVGMTAGETLRTLEKNCDSKKR